MKVLVAEDDKTSRTLLENLLSRMGYEPVSTEDGEEALAVYKGGNFKIALLDWMMPKIDGVELCRLIRALEEERDQRCYIIMVTTKSQNEDVITALEAGADDFVSKPYNAGVLESRIKAGERLAGGGAQGEEGASRPLERLWSEHDSLLRIAGILEMVSNVMSSESEGEAGSEKPEKVPRRILRWCVDVTPVSWELHHEKEDLYIQTFIDRTVKEHGEGSRIFTRASLGQVEREHRKLGSLLADLVGLLETYSEDRERSAGAETLKDIIFAYTLLLRAHLAREDDVFFPLTQRYLDGADMDGLRAAFEEIDSGELGQTLRRDLEELDDIEDRLETLASR